MFLESLEFLKDTANQSVEPHRVLEGEAKDAYFVGASLVEVDKPLPRRKHRVRNVDSLAGYASDQSKVWHDDNLVQLVIDDESDRRSDVVSWKLTDSARYKALSEDASKPRGHKEFVTFVVQNLKTEFDRDASGLLGTIRSLKFSTQDESEGSVNHGRESMGRQIQQAVTGAEDLPETIVLNVNRWGELDIYVPIEVMVVVDLDARKLSLVPLADSVVKANLNAHQQLSDLIAAAVPCDVFHGSL